LFGNHDNDSSCSMSYMLGNDVARNIDLRALLEDLLQPFMIDNTLITELLDLHKSFAEKREGALYQITMPKVDAKNLSYAAAGGGMENPYKGSECLPDIVSQLTSQASELNKESRDYITSVQARVMAAPSTPLSVKTIRLH